MTAIQTPAEPRAAADLPRLLIINGLPAAGKSTLGAAVCPLLGLPLVSKDVFKELMFDHLGWSNRVWSQQVGGTAMEILWMVTERELQAGRSIAIESNFVQTLTDRRLAVIRASVPFRAIELHCAADRQLIIDRFITRAQSPDRHPGHREAESEHLFGEFVPRLRDAVDPLLTATDGSLVVDTTVPEQIDLPALATTLRALLWPELPG